VANARTRTGGISAQALEPEANPRTWLKGAPRLDWSQCPAVEPVSAETARYWVFRGTQIRLAAVLLDFMNGHSMQEILARHDGLTVNMVKAALQFAAIGLGLSASPS
jgi:Protein of unknown function (DUF433)